MLALLLLAAALAGPAEDLARGREALRAGDTEAAEQALVACLDADPEAVDCWWELGWAHWVERNWNAVVYDWEKVRSLRPDYPELDRYFPQAREQAELLHQLVSSAEAAPASFPSRAPEGATVRIRAVGDVMLGTSFPPGYLPPEDGAHLLDPVAPLLRDADLTFANLEGPLCDDGETHKCRPDASPGSCYAFRQPTRYAAYLQAAGIDVVSTANNHNGDFGEHCRAVTDATLDQHGIAHTGRPGELATLEANGLRLAFIGFYTGASSNDLRDLETARALVRSAARDHDLVVVSFHGGAEGSKAQHVPRGHETFYGEDRGDLRAFAHAVVEAGADLVIGHGPHVLRGMEFYQGRLVAYSLGNFATYGRFSLSGPLGVGAVLEVVLDADGNFVSGRVLPTEQVGRGEPRPDPDGEALVLLRELSREDFPGTAARIARDGSISPP